MANHKSAEKRARQSTRRAARNSAAKATVRTAEKKVRSALSAKDAKSAETLLAQFASTVHKQTNKGRVHMKNAARRLSRLSAQLHKMATNATK